MKKTALALLLVLAAPLFAEETKQYIYVLRLVNPKQQWTAAEQSIIKQHAARLQKLAEEGVVIVAGRTQDDDPLGLVIFRAKSDQEADAIMRADPAVGSGLMKATVRPYAIAFKSKCE